MSKPTSKVLFNRNYNGVVHASCHSSVHSYSNACEVASFYLTYIHHVMFILKILKFILFPFIENGLLL